MFEYDVVLSNVTVVLQVSPSLETKKPGETVLYNITGLYNGTPPLGAEEKFGTATWQFGGAINCTCRMYNNTICR
ncbi:MAG: hypothetical protein LBC74_14095 [Planctomycetaceae bacterium]|nr:hypothetical protein [Planctomycetaceae bacterium]